MLRWSRSRARVFPGARCVSAGNEKRKCIEPQQPRSAVHTCLQRLTSSAMIPSVLILAVSSLCLSMRFAISFLSFLAMASCFVWSIFIRSTANLSWTLVLVGFHDGIALVACSVTFKTSLVHLVNVVLWRSRTAANHHRKHLWRPHRQHQSKPRRIEGATRRGAADEEEYQDFPTTN